MKDRLEEFVKENRSDFDLYEPPKKVWETINSNVKQTKIRRIGYAKYAAAIAIFIVGFSIGTFKNKTFQSGGTEKLSKTELIEQSQIIESEYYYVSQINQKMNELKPYFTSDPKLKQDIQVDFDELDAFTKQLKTDLNDNINNEHVIEAMIQSYEMKLSILETLLQQLKNNENEEIPCKI